jgi:hypothetical protein
LSAHFAVEEKALGRVFNRRQQAFRPRGAEKAHHRSEIGRTMGESVIEALQAAGMSYAPMPQRFHAAFGPSGPGMIQEELVSA